MPAFEAEVGMPYWIDLATSDPRKSQCFYEEVLGWEVSAEGPYRIARVQGLPIAGMIPQPADAPMPDTWVTHFLTRDIAADLAKVRALGGRVLADAHPVQLGHMALAVDTVGGMFGLIQPGGPDLFVAGGEPGTPVWHELTATTRFTRALDFYGELFDWDIRTHSGDAPSSSSPSPSSSAAVGSASGVVSSQTEPDSAFAGMVYATAEEDGAPFAGFWNAEGQFPPQVPSFWQTYLGVRDVSAAAAKAVEFGGEVIREPWDSPFGRMVLLADSTGATVTLTEVPDAPATDPRESDDVLGLDPDLG